MRRLDAAGQRVELFLRRVEMVADRNAAAAAATGLVLALGAFAGGVAAFVAIFVFLVEVLH